VTVTAVYDANVLYPSLLRDLLIRIAIAGAVRAHWSEQILDEVFRNLAANRPDLDPHLLARTRSLMNDAIRDVEVTGFEHLIAELELPDVDDRHVLAAAIHAQAETIVTFNLKDFPTAALSSHGVVAQHPDAFLTERFDENSAIVAEAIRRMSEATRNPHRTVAEIIARLDASDLPILAGRLRGYLHPAATPDSTVNP
jgi:predicted nucleic acid-binding protein